MLASVMAAVVVALLISARPADEIMTRKGNTTIVNTTQLGAQVRGFKGATPVLIHIEKNKVVKVEALPNRETPKFFARAKAVLQHFEGLTVAKAQKAEVDGVSGATFKFSDWCHRQPQKGEADNIRHGFLCLYQPQIEAANYR